MSGGRASTGASRRRVHAPAGFAIARAHCRSAVRTCAFRGDRQWCSLHRESPARVLSCCSTAAMLQAKRHSPPRYRWLRLRASSESRTITSPRKAVDLFGRREWLYVLSIASVLTLSFSRQVLRTLLRVRGRLERTHIRVGSGMACKTRE